MDEALARWLVGPAGAAALAAAAAQADPSSLAAASALRREVGAEQAAAVLHQEVLRRKAVTKFGDAARELFFTSDGLEQATRARVSAWRAGTIVAAGVTRVVDLGCGIGADALAFVRAGLRVVAVEADPVTAVFAAANLGERGTVLVGDAVRLADGLLGSTDAVFVDPARRTGRGRTWRIADVSPPWDFATGLLAGRVGCIKAAPGLSSAELPSHAAAVWVTDGGDLVETSLWSGVAGWRPGTRRALLLPGGDELEVTAADRTLDCRPPGTYLYEPDPAVIRAGGVARIADLVAGWVLAPGVAYVSSDTLVPSAFATCFAVEDVLRFDERSLRRWVATAGVGALEIKVRGIDVDPAVLRKRLKPAGPNSATLILSPTPQGARAMVARRVIPDLS